MDRLEEVDNLLEWVGLRYGDDFARGYLKYCAGSKKKISDGSLEDFLDHLDEDQARGAEVLYQTPLGEVA